MRKTLFVAGTDTEVGKTHTCEILLRAAAKVGKKSLGLKPIAAGAEEGAAGRWVNEDAQRLMAASSVQLPYEQVNPVCLPEPLSPHIAASRANKNIDVNTLVQKLKAGLDADADFTLIEGAGGWRVPINDQQSMADLAIALKVPVILVVGMRLGCINHAQLSVEAILADGLPLLGWIANRVDENMLAYEENLDTLKRMLPSPLLGEIPCNSSVEDVALYDQFDMFF